MKCKTYCELFLGDRVVFEVYLPCPVPVYIAPWPDLSL